MRHEQGGVRRGLERRIHTVLVRLRHARQDQHQSADGARRADEAEQDPHGEPAATGPPRGFDGEAERRTRDEAKQVRPVIRSHGEAKHERVPAPLQHVVAQTVAATATRAMAVTGGETDQTHQRPRRADAHAVTRADRDRGEARDHAGEDEDACHRGLAVDLLDPRADRCDREQVEREVHEACVEEHRGKQAPRLVRHQRPPRPAEIDEQPRARRTEAAALRGPHACVGDQDRDREEGGDGDRLRRRQPHSPEDLPGAARELLAARRADLLVPILDRTALAAGLVRVVDAEPVLLGEVLLLGAFVLPADQLPPQAHLVEPEVAGEVDDLLDPGVVVLLRLVAHPRPCSTSSRSSTSRCTPSSGKAL